MKKITIISPVHTLSDIRIYKKEAFSFNKHGYAVSAIFKSSFNNDDCTFISRKIPLDYKSRLKRFWLIPYILYQAIRENADVYHIHNPDTLIIGFILKFFGKKVVYDTHENFKKKIMLRQWIFKPFRKILASLVFYMEKLASNVFDIMIVTQEQQLEIYSHSLLIENSPLFKNYTYRDEYVWNKDQINLVYLGGVSEDRGVSNMISLVRLMNDIVPTKLTLIGPLINDEDELKFQNLMKKTKDIEYLGPLEQEKAFNILAKSDFGLILLNDIADYCDTNPNKLFEYMLHSLPFISTDFCQWVEKLNEIQAGIFVDVTNINSEMANYIIDFYFDKLKYDMYSLNAGEYVKSIYNWENYDEPMLIDSYRRILGV